MAAFAFTTNVVGTQDREDKNAALYRIGIENARRAALVPPGTPLPIATNPEIKSSYETCLAMTLAEIHAHNISQSDVATLQEVRALWPTATDAKRSTALAALR